MRKRSMISEAERKALKNHYRKKRDSLSPAEVKCLRLIRLAIAPAKKFRKGSFGVMEVDAQGNYYHDMIDMLAYKGFLKRVKGETFKIG